MGPQRWLIPKGKVTLERMCLPLASPTLTLLSTRGCPWAGGARGAHREEEEEEELTWSSSSMVGGGDDAAGAEIPQSQAGRGLVLDHWK